MILKELLTLIKFKIEDKPLARVEASLGALQNRLSILAGAEVVRGLYGLSVSFSDFGDQLTGAAAAAGVTTTELQKLGYAASQNGVNQQELVGALSKVTRNLYEARGGSKGAIEAFQELGISKGQIASFQSSTEALGAISDQLKQIDDPIKRQAAMMKLLGGSSAKMSQFLGVGSKGINELGEAAERMGTVVSGGQVKALADLQSTLGTLVLQLKTATTVLAATFAPAIQVAVESFSQFIAVNRLAFTMSFKKYVGNLAYALGFAYGLVEDFVGLLLDFAERHPVLTRNVAMFALAMGGLSSTLAALGSAFGLVFGPIGKFISLLSSIGAVGGSIFGPLLSGLLFCRNYFIILMLRMAALTATTLPALSAAFAEFAAILYTNPLGLLIASIVSLIALTHDLWVLWSGGKLEDTWIGKAAGKIIDAYYAMKKLLGYNNLEDDARDKADQKLRDDAAVAAAGLDGELPPLALASVPQRNLMDAEKRTNALPTLDLQPVGTMTPASGPTLDFAIDAPITINAPAGADANLVAMMAREGVRDHLNDALRDARQATVNPVRY